MAESHGAESHGGEHHGPMVRIYMFVFLALCVFTALSFVVNVSVKDPGTAMLIILVVAVCKATLVGAFFMHLKWEWGKLYFIIIPVMILGVMMMFVLLPDNVLVWHHEPAAKEAASAPADDHH